MDAGAVTAGRGTVPEEVPLLWWFVAAPALAGAPADPFGDVVRDEAERYRLHVELSTLAAKNAWSGVDRTYRKLEALGPVDLDDAALGAQAARTAGDVLGAIERLERSIAGIPWTDDPASAYVRARRQIDVMLDHHGYVHVAVYLPHPPALEVDPPPFAPEDQAAIAFAAKRLDKDGGFMGLLPIGRYAIGDVTFVVAARAPMVEVRVGTPPSSGSVIQR
ncbi:MAG: hypothetical protein ABMB14_10680 [Myxococcota bacterium]